MKEQADTAISDETFAKRQERWPTDTPDTKEAYYIREIFDSSWSCFALSYSWLKHLFSADVNNRSLPLQSGCGNGCPVRHSLWYSLMLSFIYGLNVAGYRVVIGAVHQIPAAVALVFTMLPTALPTSDSHQHSLINQMNCLLRAKKPKKKKIR